MFNVSCKFCFYQVNGVDLAEVEGGEVAITNTHSGVGRPFVLLLEFTKAQEQSSSGPHISSNPKITDEHEGAI